jgi:hypothetical protein
MASTTVSGRRAKAHAARQAAKERRQKIMIVVMLVLLVAVLAYEIPNLMHRGSSGGSSTAAPPPVSIPTTPPVATPGTSSAPAGSRALKAALKHKPHDLFAKSIVQGAPSTLGSIPNPPGLHDPFARPGSPESVPGPASPKPVTASPLPSTIVIGKPGAGRVAVSGWIVILASIPTGQGQSAANLFASSARHKNIGTVSVLNSSNRRPLRGGYWVVYTGPYPTLPKVNQAANHVHSSGFTTAYIRQLIVYKKKR